MIYSLKSAFAEVQRSRMHSKCSSLLSWIESYYSSGGKKNGFFVVGGKKMKNTAMRWMEKRLAMN